VINLTEVFGAIVTLLCGLASAYLIPWLKAKLGAEKLDAVTRWASVFVAAAEQMFKDKPGAEKLKWVEEQLAGMGFELDADALRAMIEAIVLELKREVQG